MELSKEELTLQLEELIESEAKRKIELEEQRKEEAKLLKAFIDENPKRFIESMCEAILKIDRESKNPFRVIQDAPGISRGWFEVIERGNAFLSGMARIVLDKVRGVGPAESGDGYSPFLNIVIDYFNVSENIKGEEIVKNYDLLSIQLELFNRVSNGFEAAIDTACHHVFEGVPLYRKVGEEQSYERIAFDDPLYHYIYKKGEFFESGSTIHVPHWMDGLYVKDRDMAAHDAFFSGEMGLDDAERDMRRRALWNELGISNNGANDRTRQAHQTKLLCATQAVIARYYGSQFSENDPSTITPQKVVVDWLMETYALSRRAAEAIDIVTRPDSRR